jgi:hypothetical protein
MRERVLGKAVTCRLDDERTYARCVGVCRLDMSTSRPPGIRTGRCHTQMAIGPSTMCSWTSMARPMAMIGAMMPSMRLIDLSLAGLSLPTSSSVTSCRHGRACRCPKQQAGAPCPIASTICQLRRSLRQVRGRISGRIAWNR